LANPSSSGSISADRPRASSHRARSPATLRSSGPPSPGRPPSGRRLVPASAEAELDVRGQMGRRRIGAARQRDVLRVGGFQVSLPLMHLGQEQAVARGGLLGIPASASRICLALARFSFPPRRARDIAASADSHRAVLCRHRRSPAIAATPATPALRRGPQARRPACGGPSRIAGRAPTPGAGTSPLPPGCREPGRRRTAPPNRSSGPADALRRIWPAISAGLRGPRSPGLRSRRSEPAGAAVRPSCPASFSRSARVCLARSESLFCK